MLFDEKDLARLIRSTDSTVLSSSQSSSYNSGRILAFMILHGQTFFYPSVSTFIIASLISSSTDKNLQVSFESGGL